jgi:hypothetical protein
MQNKRDLRSMRQAAMAGDHSAARALLRLYQHDRLANEIKHNNLPFPPRALTMIRALCAGTNSEWEVEQADGTFVNDLQFPPAASPRRTRQRKVLEE